MSPDTRIYSNSGLYLERPDLLYAAVDGVNDVRILQGKVPCRYSGNNEERRFISYTEEFSNNKKRRQVDADALAFILDSESGLYRPAATNLIFTDRDLYYEGSDYAVGLTFSDKNISIQSIYRIIKATKNEVLQKKAVRCIARRGYATLVGLTKSEDYVTPRVVDGVPRADCSKEDCTMHQLSSVDEILNLVESPFYQDNIAGLCLDCAKSLIIKS